MPQGNPNTVGESAHTQLDRFIQVEYGLSLALQRAGLTGAARSRQAMFIVRLAGLLADPDMGKWRDGRKWIYGNATTWLTLIPGHWDNHDAFQRDVDKLRDASVLITERVSRNEMHYTLDFPRLDALFGEIDYFPGLWFIAAENGEIQSSPTEGEDRSKGPSNGKRATYRNSDGLEVVRNF